MSNKSSFDPEFRLSWGSDLSPSDHRSHLSVLSSGLSPFLSTFSFSVLDKFPLCSGGLVHAPRRNISALSISDKQLCVRNALRYFPSEFHPILSEEFARELTEFGHIYMYRFSPVGYPMKAHDISLYPAKSFAGASLIHMIQNVLDASVALYPQELVTYGGNGSVFSNWAQYHLTVQYLCGLTEEQTLYLYSGHPLGVFPSTKESPRCVITNGMVIGQGNTTAAYEKLYAQGNSQYGQMTAGSFCYIGPQGIVHGTTLTLLNAGRKYLNVTESDLTGKLFVTSGLGGMSGAQAKAAVICKCIAVIAEVKRSQIVKRKDQGWLREYYEDLPTILKRIEECRKAGESTSIAYSGNVVDLWEVLADKGVPVDLGSDQTSCHDPYGGGYYPVGLTFEEASKMISEEPLKFKQKVHESLIRQVKAINRLADKGMSFWDYGNSFLLQARIAGAEINDEKSPYPNKFKYPSYVEEFMGDIFSLGFGPFRWVCTSGDDADLALTDEIAAEVIRDLMAEAEKEDTPLNRLNRDQFKDNLLWVLSAQENQLVVGSKARILYTNAKGRIETMARFNRAVSEKRLRAPIVLSRDHHDVSGADSPYRETSNITDGSNLCADMTVSTIIGDAHRGATWVALHNGGGTGWGNAINGGFGLVLDGTPEAEAKARKMLHWDVHNGITRRMWGGNENAKYALRKEVDENQKMEVTFAHKTEQKLLENLF